MIYKEKSTGYLVSDIHSLVRVINTSKDQNNSIMIVYKYHDREDEYADSVRCIYVKEKSEFLKEFELIDQAEFWHHVNRAIESSSKDFGNMMENIPTVEGLKEECVLEETICNIIKYDCDIKEDPIVTHFENTNMVWNIGKLKLKISFNKERIGRIELTQDSFLIWDIQNLEPKILLDILKDDFKKRLVERK